MLAREGSRWTQGPGARDEGAADSQLLVEHNQVSVQAGRNCPLALTQPEQAGWIGRCRDTRLLQAQVEEANGVPHRGVHGQGAAGDRSATGDRRPSRADDDLGAGEAVAAVGHARGVDRVGDKPHSLRPLGPEREPERGRVDMDAVADQLAADLGEVEDGARDSGLAVVQRAHRVEQVRRAARAAPRRTAARA